MLSTSEPKDMVYDVVKGMVAKGVCEGRWTMSEGGEVKVTVNGPRQYTFIQELKVCYLIA